MKWNDCILWTDLVGCQKLGIISEDKSSQKLKHQKTSFTKIVLINHSLIKDNNADLTFENWNFKNLP